MDDDKVSKGCKEIREASDFSKLKFLFTVAYDEARGMGDKNAMRCFIDAKDARKKELEHAAR
jgi:hypothetical protein